VPGWSVRSASTSPLRQNGPSLSCPNAGPKSPPWPQHHRTAPVVDPTPPPLPPAAAKRRPQSLDAVTPMALGSQAPRLSSQTSPWSHLGGDEVRGLRAGRFRFRNAFKGCVRSAGLKFQPAYIGSSASSARAPPCSSAIPVPNEAALQRREGWVIERVRVQVQPARRVAHGVRVLAQNLGHARYDYTY
jgi:hypothetical protein